MKKQEGLERPEVPYPSSSKIAPAQPAAQEEKAVHRHCQRINAELLADMRQLSPDRQQCSLSHCGQTCIRRVKAKRADAFHRTSLIVSDE